VRGLTYLIGLVPIVGCASIGRIDDGTSLAYGYHNEGRLVNGVQLPSAGDGYLVPQTWAKRGNNWGTEELVGLIVRTGRRLVEEIPETPLFVADLSPPRGGPSRWHHSHQTGRDADLLFFARDPLGRPLPPPPQMPVFLEDGKTADGTMVFDVARNWKLVKALIEDPATDVQYLFIYQPLADMMLLHARAIGEPTDVVARASALLKQPGDSLKHDDHLHVRIYCPASDRPLGCRDRGPLRWLKKVYKYLAGIRRLEALLPQALQAVGLRPFCHYAPPSLQASRSLTSSAR